MVVSQPTEDFYAVLEIDQDVDQVTIRSSYRRLAKLRHPDRAQDKPSATADFQLLQQAYYTLSDAERRRDYDRIYVAILGTQRCRQSTHQNKSTQQNKSTTAAPSKSHESTTGLDVAAHRIRLQNLRSNEASYRKAVAVEREKATNLKTVLRELRTLSESDCSDQTCRTSLLGLSISKPKFESTEDELKRERTRLDRMNTIRIKEHQLDNSSKSIRDIESKLRKIEADISRIQQGIRLTEVRQEQLKEKERREKEKKDNEKKENERREEAEAYAKWLVEEIARQHAAAAGRQREKEQQDQSSSQYEESWHHESSVHSAELCQHRMYWDRVEGRQTCSRCTELTRRFAFRCPQCKIIACAQCRDILKVGETSSEYDDLDWWL